MKGKSKNPYAVALGRRGGRRSARMRLLRASAATLSAWGRRTIRARWERRHRMTLGRVAEMAKTAATSFGPALKEFYREMAERPSRILIADDPTLTGRPEYDAYLAAVAEVVAGDQTWPDPQWIFDPKRFLSEPYFGTAPSGMRIFLMQQSPIEFRRRNIFVEKEAVGAAIKKWK